MYTRVSQELIQKIEQDIQEVTDVRDGDLYDVCLLSFTSEEEHLRQECIEWREVINIYYLSSYSGGSLKNFLHYKYIRPSKIYRHTVEFDYEINYNQSWKDWFIIDERKDYASIVPA